MKKSVNFSLQNKINSRPGKYQILLPIQTNRLRISQQDIQVE